MQFLDLNFALQLTREIVRDNFAKKGKAISGATLKALLLKKAEGAGKSFQERVLGFRSFLDFVSSDKELTVERRDGSDFLVQPSTGATVDTSSTDTLSPQLLTRQDSQPRIREDIWFAFMSFPRQGIRREYNRETGRVLYLPENTETANGVLITPFTKEQQIEWRKEFTKTVDAGLRESLEQALGAHNAFREFSISLKLQPDLMKKWNVFLLSKVEPVISAWAEQNKIPTETWRQRKTEWRDNQRRALYRLLDEVPVEDLLETKVPLRWFLSEGKK